MTKYHNHIDAISAFSRLDQKDTILLRVYFITMTRQKTMSNERSRDR